MQYLSVDGLLSTADFLDAGEDRVLPLVCQKWRETTKRLSCRRLRKMQLESYGNVQLDLAYWLVQWRWHRRHSFAGHACWLEGLDPLAAYFHSFGGREGLIDTSTNSGAVGYHDRYRCRPQLLVIIDDCLEPRC